jgi:multimeric flavodoxin WrbA
MEVLAFNASPRKEKSVSEIIMNLFLAGAAEGGAETESHHIVDLDIKGCVGCFKCWVETPGKCIYRDDMDWIIPKFMDADVIYLGTPIYNSNITHYLQKMTERMLPTSLPTMVEENGSTIHPERYERKTQQLVLAAVAGFPDTENFNQVRALFPGAIYIFLPTAQILQDPEGSKYVSYFTDAVKEAGRQMAAQGEIDEAVKEKLVVKFSHEMKKMLREQANIFFESRINEV